MIVEVSGRNRCAMTFHICGGGDEGAPCDRQPLRNKAGVIHGPVTNYGVETIGCCVDEAIVQFERQLNLGMLLKKCV